MWTSATLLSAGDLRRRSSWWNSAVALTTVIDYTRQTGDTRYAWIVPRTFQVDRGSFPAGARSSDPIDGDFISRSTDDSECVR